MPGTVPQPTPIFHITNIDNLSLIVASGALRTIAELTATDVAYTSIAHPSIQDRRTYTQVSCGPGGCLHEYVPYYFGVRSPMLYTINLGNIEGYEQGQDAVIRGGPRESDSCVRWDPTYLRRISEHGEATEFFGGLQGESCA